MTVWVMWTEESSAIYFFSLYFVLDPEGAHLLAETTCRRRRWPTGIQRVSVRRDVRRDWSTGVVGDKARVDDQLKHKRHISTLRDGRKVFTENYKSALLGCIQQSYYTRFDENLYKRTTFFRGKFPYGTPRVFGQFVSRRTCVIAQINRVANDLRTQDQRFRRGGNNVPINSKIN